MAEYKIYCKKVDGVEIINSTPHPITFGVGEEKVSVPSSDLINASPKEEVLHSGNGVTVVKTVFEPSPEGQAIIDAFKAAFPNAVIVGSIIAAQAYPGQVYGMTPCPGYERVAPEEKRMNPHKFTSFGE